MEKKEKIEVFAKPDDLHFIFCSAIRYGLGRRTYATSLIPEFITDNLLVLNEKALVNLLADIKRYEEDRVVWEYKDDECDYRSWMEFKSALITEFKKRNYKPSKHRDLTQWLKETGKDE